MTTSGSNEIPRLHRVVRARRQRPKLSALQLLQRPAQGDQAVAEGSQLQFPVGDTMGSTARDPWDDWDRDRDGMGVQILSTQGFHLLSSRRKPVV